VGRARHRPGVRGGACDRQLRLRAYPRLAPQAGLARRLDPASIWQTPLVRIVAILAGAAAIALTSVAAAAPAPNGRLLAITTGAPPAVSPTLVWVDAATLALLPGPTVALPPGAAGGLLSPDRSMYVFGSNGQPALILFDLERMQLAARLTTGRAGSAYPIAWPEPRRLFVEGWACCPVHAEVVIVDPVDRSVVARVPLAGGGFTAGRTTAGIVALVEPKTGIKAVRIAVIDREGMSRSVTVSRIKAGTRWRGKGADRFASIRQPGFAVDRSGQAAYVIDSSGLVAQVDLRTLQVSYHSRATRQLARSSKQINGPMVYAHWVGDGRIVVSGTTAKMQKTSSGWSQTWSPAGVALLDTRTWTSRMLDPGASSFTISANGVLVPANGTLSAYDIDGTLRYRVPLPAGNPYVSIFGEYAYVWTTDTVTTVDLKSGSVVATLPKPSLYLVATDS
jgi:hypothetical protein